MSKFMRIVSTLMVVTGLTFLSIYVWSSGTDRTDILNQPSYYIVQNYWFLFVSGIITIAFSVLGSFFSWFKAMDPQKEALPNAGYATSDDIHAWVTGTVDCVEVQTEILSGGQDSGDSKTEIL